MIRKLSAMTSSPKIFRSAFCTSVSISTIHIMLQTPNTHRVVVLSFRRSSSAEDVDAKASSIGERNPCSSSSFQKVISSSGQNLLPDWTGRTLFSVCSVERTVICACPKNEKRMQGYYKSVYLDENERSKQNID